MAVLAFNQIILGGKMVADPELQQTTNGISVIKFRIAVQRKGKQDVYLNSEVHADFFVCVAWRQTAEFIARYFRKGNTIFLVGHLESKTYSDTRTGETRFATEVIVDDVRFVESKSESSRTSVIEEVAQESAPDETPHREMDFTPDVPDIPDDLPF